MGKREKGAWKAESCDFPLISENYESPKEQNSPHLRPKFTFRAAVLVPESPLYPVPRHEMVPMKRSVEELVALYETGFKLRKPPPSPPLLQPQPPLLSDRNRSPSFARTEDPTRKRMSIVIPPPTISVTEQFGSKQVQEEPSSTPEDSPLLVSLSKRIPAMKRMLHPRQHSEKTSVGLAPEPLPQPNDIFGKVKQAILSQQELSSPTQEAPPVNLQPAPPLISVAPLAPEVFSEIESQEGRPSILVSQPIPILASPTKHSTVVDIPRTSILSKSSSAASLRRPLKPQERAETVLNLSREVMIVPKVLVPQLPAFRSRRAKAGWKQVPELSVQGENKAARLAKSFALGIFGNEALNHTLPIELRKPEVVILGAKEGEPLERMMAESFSAKKLPPHRLAVDYNLFKGVRKVARLRLQMRKMRQQLMAV